MKDLQNKSVLIVDDDPGMLRAMTKVLANEGMYVTGVADPTAVVTKLAEPGKRFDLVVTDLRMPAFSGRGVLALAGALPELPVHHHHSIWRARCRSSGDPVRRLRLSREARCCCRIS
jgi:DNA-binding NtrC family response regulator